MKEGARALALLLLVLSLPAMLLAVWLTGVREQLALTAIVCFAFACAFFLASYLLPSDRPFVNDPFDLLDPEEQAAIEEDDSGK